MQKATNINKLYNYWTDFERIYLSKILGDSFLQKKHSSKTYMHLTLEEKPYMFYLLVNIKKFSLITSTDIIGK